MLLDALSSETLQEARAALYRIAAGDRARGWSQDYGYGGDDHVNQRIWNLPSRDAIFCDLAEHAVALRFVKKVLGWPALLSSMSANIVAKGGDSMMVHADQGYMPQPWSRAHGINVAWCIDDFNADNGATRFVPGSHLLNRMSVRGEAVPETAALEAPAGSAIIIDGRLWHTNGPSTSAQSRAGIFSWYTLPIYLPQENWFLSVNPIVRQLGSENLQTLLGFRPQVLGRINGLDRLELSTKLEKDVGQ